MEKVIVTGGAGYIGSHTIVELIESGYSPIIIDDFSNSDPSVVNILEELTSHSIPVINGQVQEDGLIDKICSEYQDICGIIHFAASKAVGESVEDPVKYYDNNINSTLTVLQAMKNYNIPHLVFSSSCTVYGQPDMLPVTEETPRKPAESPYGNTKQICEDIIRDTISSEEVLKGVSLRYFNPIGAHPSGRIGELPIGIPANLVPFMTQTAAGLRDKVTVFGIDYNTQDGSAIRDYIHVSDLAKAHVLTLKYMDTSSDPYDVYNIGIGEGASVLEVIKTFEKVNDLKLNYEIGSRRPGDIEKIWADSSKANKILNWKPERDLDESLRSAWKWQQNLIGNAV